MSPLLDAIGWVGDSFDKLGGRAVRGVLGGKPRELASFVPFSDRFGLTDPNDIVSGRDLTDAAGLTRKGDSDWGSFGLGLGAEMLLDPTNLLGGGLLAKGLGRASKPLSHADDLADVARLGDNARAAMRVPIGGGDLPKHIANLADAYGPQYKTTPFDLAKALQGVPTAGRHQVTGLLEHPFVDRIASELPEGSKFLGRGEEALAFESPLGSVIRVGPAHSKFLKQQLLPASGRPDIPEVLQPFRSNLIGNYLVEHLPRVMPISGGAAEKARFNAAAAARRTGAALSPDATSEYVREANRAATNLGWSSRVAATELKNSIINRNLSFNPWDVRPWNVSLTPEGKAIVHDGGAVWLDSSAGSIPLVDRLTYPTPNQIDELAQLDAPAAVRQAMDAGLAQGTHGQGIDLPSLLDYHGIEADRKLLDQFLAGTPTGAVSGFPSEPLPFDEMLRLLAGSGSPEPFSRLSGSPIDRSALLAHMDELNLGEIRPSLHSTPVPTAPRAGSGGLDTRFRPLREQFSMVKGLDEHPTLAGFYSPESRLGAASNPTAARHEIGHGIVDQAVKAGPRAISSLPVAWQPGAWLELLSRKTGYGGALGQYADEVAQYGTQYRGLRNQIAGSLGFATNPDYVRAYAAQLADKSPLVAHLIQVPPYVAEHPELVGAGAAGVADLIRLADSASRN